MTVGGLGPGDILGGKYRIVRVIGEGGMAIVFEAQHVKLKQRVAIKVLRDELVAAPNLVERFEREGRSLSTLRSRNFVRVYDVDETMMGAPYLVMEFLDGNDLDTELARRGALPIAEACGYVEQACSAMREAHAHGIVHRDLKPTNIFLADEAGTRVLKVLDFGIATDGPPTSTRLTRTDSVMGTPLYMAPEQFRSTRDVDARADIWALGATLYELLTGVPPFTGSATTIGVQIVTEEVQPLESLRSDIPPELSQVVIKALAKNRDHRFQTMQELADALIPFCDAMVLAPRLSAHSFADIAEVAVASTMPEVPPLSESAIATARGATPPVTADESTAVRPMQVGTTGLEVRTAPSPTSVAVAADARPSTSDLTPDRPRSRRGLVAGVIVAAVALLGGTAFFVNAKAGGHADANPLPPTTISTGPDAAVVLAVGTDLDKPSANPYMPGASSSAPMAAPDAAAVTSATPRPAASARPHASSAATSAPPAAKTQPGAADPPLFFPH